MDFISFDLETTGTVSAVDDIVEIGAVKFLAGKAAGTFSTLIDPKRSMPAAASAVNGITDDMLAGQPLIQDMLGPFAEFCEDLPLVAHNAPFDTQFLVSDIKKYESLAPRGMVFDTLPISRKVFPGLPNYKLGTLVKNLNIPSGTFHRAEEDASYCGYLFQKIIEKISLNGQAPPVENIIALTGRPAFYFPQIVQTGKQLDLLDML